MFGSFNTWQKMNKKIFIFLIVLVFLLSTTFSEETTTIYRASNVQLTNNSRLLGFVLSTRRMVDIFTCAHVCLAYGKCASFNHLKETGNSGFCELNGDGYLYKNTKPRYHAGWSFGEIAGKNYAFNVTFTTLDGQNAVGPTDISGYKGTLLQDAVQLRNGIQIWRVPITGTYTISALGASGGNGTNGTGTWRLGGKGARIKGGYYLLRGTLLKILVGQTGNCSSSGRRRPGGGGGGSFVTFQDNKPLIIAGGGGGGAAPWTGFHHGEDAQISENGSTYGGVEGLGGKLYDARYSTYDRLYRAGAGGGLLTNGASGNYTTGGQSFVEGGQGGVGRLHAQGGFGGGGGASLYPGGGGGYSGGGVVRATRYTKAGGGGSYNGGVNKENLISEHSGPGSVQIKLIESNHDIM